MQVARTAPATATRTKPLTFLETLTDVVGSFTYSPDLLQDIWVVFFDARSAAMPIPNSREPV